jgi:hypothetical protein
MIRRGQGLQTKRHNSRSPMGKETAQTQAQALIDDIMLLEVIKGIVSKVNAARKYLCNENKI